MSTSANVVALRPTEQSDRMASLLRQRDELQREIARVRAPEKTRSLAASSLTEAEAGLRSLDEAERVAWISWAGNPNGTQPAPRVYERREAIRELRAIALIKAARF